METKVGHICHRRLAIALFGLHICRKDGHQDVCRECRHRMYLEKNKHRVRALSHYPDDEMVDELVRRGKVYSLLHCMDRNDIQHFLQNESHTATGEGEQKGQ